jgi:hypothetical protein
MMGAASLWERQKATVAGGTRLGFAWWGKSKFSRMKKEKKRFFYSMQWNIHSRTQQVKIQW